MIVGQEVRYGKGPLYGQVIAVTGASRGTGLWLSKTLMAAGVEVAMMARGRDRLDAGATAIGPAA